jgi:cellulose synthase/poly-beta-1,6-N-acetylglucosamine synthase-like glycosyltransferase
MNARAHSGANGMAEYWVVIPAYNEAATIRDVALRAARQCKRVIVVDDGSTDGTAEALVGLPVTVLRNTVNCGKAASLWTAMASMRRKTFQDCSLKRPSILIM